MSELHKQGFKLLAIQPRKGCHPEFRKVLKENEIYSFYSSYRFDVDNKGEVMNIQSPKSEPRLYDLDGLLVNISAVVGKNGSGKSTLTELLYYTIYFVSTSLHNREEKNKTVLIPNFLKLGENLNWLISEREKNYNELKILRVNKKKLLVKNPSWQNKKKYVEIVGFIRAKTNAIKDLNPKIKQLENDILEEKEAHQLIIENLKISIFYLLNGVFYELQINRIGDKADKVDSAAVINAEFEANESLNFYKFLSNGKVLMPSYNSDEVLNHFFYTVAINYSHYALNSRYIGKWINTLFHKNDAYFSPGSINPMRTKGDFDINREHSLALYRLLLYVLLEYRQTKNNVALTDHQCVKAVRFTLDPTKTEDVPLKLTPNGFSGSKQYSLALRDIQSAFFNDWIYQEVELTYLSIPFKEQLFKYLVKKYLQIRKTYNFYGREWNDDKLLSKLTDENTHVTFKLKQAVNFIKQCLEDDKKAAIWNKKPLDTFEQPYIDLNLETLDQWVPKDIQDPVELMNYLPPPIFNIDFLLMNNESDGITEVSEISSFSALSSGEQQFIHSTQSAIYHLNNIQSAHRNEDGRQTYQAINIIYDEIELYFHPEYQRKFIHQFLKSIKRLNLGSKNGIRSINILFSTHSPFVLSDIPSSNILRLDAGKPVSTIKNSLGFGANIYTLLRDSFFLDAYIGEHARQEIQKLINTLKEDKKENDFNKSDKEILLDSSEQMKNRIELIGEPFLRDKLWEMYYIKFDKEKRINELQRELLRLKGEGI